MNSSSHSSAAKQNRLFGSAARWWRDEAVRAGSVTATRNFFAALWEFARDSTPERRRSLYGDADYDWEHRVNTTSAAVGWRDRLLGMFHSPYQPTEPGLFREMIDALVDLAKVDLQDFTFIDLGSGKGRTLLMASDYPFHRIIGVELLPALHAIALENLAKYQGDEQKCFSLQSICADAVQFEFPLEPLVLFLFNPLPEAGLRQVLEKLEQSLKARPRAVYVVYHNPLLAPVLAGSALLGKIGGTHQYAIYAGVSG